MLIKKLKRITLKVFFYLRRRLLFIFNLIRSGYLTPKNFNRALKRLKTFGIKGIVLHLEEDFQYKKLKASNAFARYEDGEVDGSIGSTINLREAKEIRVDIVICIHNQLELVKNCVNSVLRNTENPYNMILIDDGSAEETRDWLKDLARVSPNITHIRNERAQGYSKAANIGLSISTADYVILLNSDTEVSWEWAAKLVRAANSHPKIAAVGPLSNNATSQTVDSWDEFENYTNHYPPLYPEVGFLNGFCICLTRSAIDEVGLMDHILFTPAYGEENDWCIRAVSKGFKLRIADDVFVKHLGSSSYTRAKAIELEDIAGKRLNQKHDSLLIRDHLRLTYKNPGVRTIQLRYEKLAEIESASARIRTFAGMRVAFVLPAGGRGGGANVILSEATRLAESGVFVRLINLASSRAGFTKTLDQSTLSSGIEFAWVEDWSELDKFLDVDVAVATLYSSVGWLLSAAKNLKVKPRFAYYIQDFEPWFFPDGSRDQKIAIESYQLAKDWLNFTKSEWNARVLKNNSKIEPRVIGPSVETRNFYPVRGSCSINNRKKIVALVRFSTPRRNPSRTVDALNTLSRYFGDQFEICAIGMDLLPDQYDLLDEKIVKLGHLNPNELRALFSTSLAFLDYSSFQAMGLTALEAMSSGAIVITEAEGGIREFINSGSNGFLIEDDPEFKKLISLLRNLATDYQLKERMSFKAVETGQSMLPELAAANMAEFLFGDISK